jgi:hypothetical protein
MTEVRCRIRDKRCDHRYPEKDPTNITLNQRKFNISDFAIRQLDGPLNREFYGSRNEQRTARREERHLNMRSYLHEKHVFQ